jgi:hypothetical protein
LFFFKTKSNIKIQWNFSNGDERFGESIDYESELQGYKERSMISRHAMVAEAYARS